MKGRTHGFRSVLVIYPALAQGALLLVSGVSFLAAVVLNAALVFTVGRLLTLRSGGPTWA